MLRKRLTHLSWLMALALAACQAPQPAPPTPLPNSTSNAIIITDGTEPAPTGPVVVTGLFTYSDIALTVYYAAPAVALVDLHGFVLRDPQWPIPVESQVLGHLELNPAGRLGEYRLRLPAQPAGTYSRFDPANAGAAGVQVFTIAYLPNLSGGPFAEGDDARHGWPTDLASVRTRSGDDEIIGGKLVAWAAEEGQAFPTGFGADGRLFTADDPLGQLPAGYSIVDLDREPFAVSQEHDANLPLYEATGTAINDLAGLTYTEAFEQLFSEVEQRWAFNGHSDPPVDWAALHAEVAPRVAAAEVNQDALAYFKALQLFSWRLPDGYTTISGGDLGIQDYLRETNGGYGLAVRELDDGRVLVTFVLAGGPADQAGLAVGQEVLAFNDQPIDAAIAAVEPYGGPFSMHNTRRYQQARYLLRAVAGTRATLTVAGADGAPLTATLTAVDERTSFAFSSILAGYEWDPLESTCRHASLSIL